MQRQKSNGVTNDSVGYEKAPRGVSAKCNFVAGARVDSPHGQFINLIERRDSFGFIKDIYGRTCRRVVKEGSG